MNPTYAEVEAALLGRWPETRLEPSLERITALCRLLGDPQDAYPVVHLTGTNGKSSTARMIDALLRALDLRTGRFTSPHLQSMTERISLDGEPLTEEQFVEAFADVAAYAQVVDDSQPHPISFFELTVAMAYAAFADAPVDAAVVEVGMGGAWDATNVATGRVAVVTPVAVDHTAYLGDRAVDIALEKSGIIKPGAHAVLAAQEPEVLDVLMRRSMEVGATALREGVDFGVADRLNAVGGQQISLQGLNARYDDVLLQLHGAHQAQNAAVALASVEAFVGAELDGDLVRSAFGEVTSPGRLEVVRRSPTVLVDSAHNPHGVRAALEAVQDSFTFSPLVGVVSVMADKDVEEMLRELEPVLAHVVCTQNSLPRAMRADELGELAEEVFGEDRVTVERGLDDALVRAISMAETGAGMEEAIGSGGVIVIGSVVTAGEARVLLGAGAVGGGA
ncbi:MULTISPECIES: folylpolyglutamate synthase/dihydrofolate synthase family protein [unclassified Aeromicrobium]|uniref:bifunctional folylpolyglutamate synthase/dihydrofolate synthase n=1 Tax=unclassified Aeromicrobium TaxID=2633570 RepID=UPI0006F5D55E|nr:MULTISPECIES: folylpolyglutamate synthase/dihydrofolate synthase family protein [unclassified Aeromicrobium]KQO37198.1 dihydrofolate synthase [Aeromicrobium sp. Leaf245]KQP26040.1 dihydrofolate synthase [Aeromicrobium sp. Leaf272]KQP75361.1 dihydrofolate synthase [Aeromicrobium sp. Leaf289]KQP84742.1 dihydrofolate synthase [Aeromicrobium sp. Leaf291]